MTGTPIMHQATLMSYRHLLSRELESVGVIEVTHPSLTVRVTITIWKM